MMPTKQTPHLLRPISLLVFICYSLSSIGCSIVGFEVEPISKRVESRLDKSRPSHNKVEINLSASPIGDEVIVDLRQIPYYSVETREFIQGKYKGSKSATSWLIGLVEAAAWLYVVKELPRIPSDTSSSGKEIDLDSAEPWQRAVFLGVVADFALAYFLGEDIWKNQKPAERYTEWKAMEQEQAGDLKPLRNHPFRLEIPALDLGVDLQTEDGTASVSLHSIVEQLPRQKSRFHPFYQQLTDNRIEFRVTTRLEGQEYSQLFPIQNRQMVQHFRNLSNGVDMLVSGQPQLMPKPVATANWDSGEIRAGSEARLNLQVENRGKGDLYRFIAETDSRVSLFDQRQLEFGHIPPNGSRTLSFTFDTNPETTSQEIPVLVQFEEYNNYVPDSITTKLYIREEERPKFEYAYRIVDGGTEKSVGNGDGIIQYGESFDLVLTVRNSGRGAGKGVKANLTLMVRESIRSSGNRGVALFGDSQVSLGNIPAGDSTTTQFNIGLKPNARVASIPIYLTLSDQKFSDAQLAEKFIIPVDKRVSPKIVVIDLDATVIGQTAPIHSGADAQATIVAQVPQHSHLSINGQLGDWYRIESGDLQGWVHRQSVTTQEVIEPKNRQRPIQPTRVIKVFQQMPPSLTLVAPEVSASISVAIGSLEVIAVAADDKGVKEVKLTVNGKSVSSRGMKVKQQLQKTVTVKEAVPLQYGQNRIELVAVDVQEQQSEPIAFIVERKREMKNCGCWPSESATINIPRFQDSKIPKLKYADDDAKAIAAYLGQIGVPSDHIVLLTDGQS